MLAEDFNRTIDNWLQELQQYSFEQLCAQPAAGSWSLGQVYMHLINTTNYFISQVNICLSTNEHATEEAAPAAKTMFAKNELPDAILEGPPSNAHTPQPQSKEQLVNDLLHLKKEIAAVTTPVYNNSYKGKTKHPGLHYLNAGEWLQFAEMHFHHHLRQKKRIDNFLKTIVAA